MKTDELFCELFKIDPRSLFRLVHVEIEGEYSFKSITAKSTEKRIDGAGPNVFVEIQGYFDPKIYWRTFQELCLYYQQNDDSSPFIAIMLFLDDQYDPKNCPVAQVAFPHQFIRANLLEFLQSVWNQAGIVTVLKPLVLSHKKQVFESTSVENGYSVIRTFARTTPYSAWIIRISDYPAFSRH